MEEVDEYGRTVGEGESTLDSFKDEDNEEEGFED